MRYEIYNYLFVNNFAKFDSFYESFGTCTNSFRIYNSENYT